MDRVAEAQDLVDSVTKTPALADTDRELLSTTLRSLSQSILDRGAPEQLLHGEPHGDNLLRTKHGLLFIDLETCCIGPVAFDIAHCSGANVVSGASGSFFDAQTPFDVADHYPGADRELVRLCQALMLAMVAAWRWDRDDYFPGGRQMGEEYLREIRNAVGRDGLD
jgi:Ser/Thr protein kinase RdoA (MazF antagonist)